MVLEIAKGLLKVGGGAIATAVILAYQHGEIMDFDGMIEVARDSVVPAVVMCLIWLKARSPQDSKELDALRAELAALKEDKQ